MSQTPTDPAPRRRVEDQEEMYYQGPPSMRGNLKPFFAWGLGGLAVVAAPILLFVVTKKNYPPLWVAMSLVVVGLVMMYVPVLSLRSTRYRISNLRVEWERGWLSKSIDTVELAQLADIKFHQTLGQRIMGVGTIELFTNDPRTPVVTLEAVPGARGIFDKLKERVTAAKTRQGAPGAPSDRA
jgi:uncharacterized membrane protein YdbT with pleckstrin-like domain